MCSLQTSTGTMLMHRVVENMGATELRKKYDLLPLFFWRLAGGAELLLEDDIIYEIKMRCCQRFQKWPQK